MKRVTLPEKRLMQINVILFYIAGLFLIYLGVADMLDYGPVNIGFSPLGDLIFLFIPGVGLAGIGDLFKRSGKKQRLELTPSQKLDELDKMFKNDQISEEEFSRKKDDILSKM